MTDCQLNEPFGECGPVRTMQQNSDYWHRMYQQEKKSRERLEKEAYWLEETIEKIIYISYDYIHKPEADEWTEKLIELSLGNDEISWREAAQLAVARAEKETK